MKQPIDKNLLKDKKLIRIAEQFVKKKMMSDPYLSKLAQSQYKTSQSKQGGFDMTLNVLKSSSIKEIRKGFQNSVPIKQKLQKLTSAKDAGSVKFGAKDDQWYDQRFNNPG